ncbi:MAG: ATP-binding protein [Actinomycetota bacterium]
MSIPRVQDRIELEISPLPEHVGTARLVVAAAARSLGVDEESVADLKMVISELCTEAIESRQLAPSEEPIRIRLFAMPESLEVDINSGVGELRSLPYVGKPPETPERLERSLRGNVIYALFPDVQFLPDDTGVAVRFSVPREPELGA